MTITLQDVIPEISRMTKEECVLHLLRVLHAPIRGTIAEQILELLHESDMSWKMNELQKKVGLKQYKFYEELARLEGAGFIQRRKNIIDSRITEVHLTPAGKFVQNHFKEAIS